MNKLKIGLLQCAFPDNEEQSLCNLEEALREMASSGARVALLPELFQGHYFCQHEKKEDFARAKSIEESPSVRKMQALSEELNLAIPVSFFEKSQEAFFNSVAFFDCGKFQGLYRKAHIPMGPGYYEQTFFSPGDTGFKVWKVDDLCLGVGICWDQWFPEAARAMSLMGAEILLYPTAIGTEPHMPQMDTAAPWRRVMQGHAVANSVVVAAANRVGGEDQMSFYGTSFVCGPDGEILQESPRGAPDLFIQEIDIKALRAYRKDWKMNSFRRPELYSKLVEGLD